jgi:pyridoxal phosphate enzyme (YggS family)
MHKSISNLIDIKKEINSKYSTQSSKMKIIAVTKTFPIENILPLIDYGHLDFGENKVQEAVDKWTNIKNAKKELNLHMIGKLQSNKVKYAVKLFDYIHSLDSIKLAKKISEEQNKINKNLKLFIQINIGNEVQKNGISMEELPKFYKVCLEEFNLNIIGLMCLPPNNIDTSLCFERMRKASRELNLNELSMGMSSDYLNAIRFNSSFVRIGSKIFGKRN